MQRVVEEVTRSIGALTRAPLILWMQAATVLAQDHAPRHSGRPCRTINPFRARDGAHILPVTGGSRSDSRGATGKSSVVVRVSPESKTGEALVDVLDALDQTRKAYRLARHDLEAAAEVGEAGRALRRAADVLRGRLAPRDRERADELAERRRVDT